MNRSHSQTYVWHHRLHEEWGNERLHFWRMAFFPTYDRGAIQASVEAAFAEHAVESYAMYELFGAYDVLLRVWLPTATTHAAFQKTLEERLLRQHMQVCDVFSVGAILRHWPWDDEPATPPPSADLIESRWPDEKIDKGNQLAVGAVTEEEVGDLHGALAPCVQGAGIKFAVAVTSPSQLLTIDARASLSEHLQEVVASAASSGGSLQELSLYEGAGFCQFLILGRAEQSDFFALRRLIMDQVNEAKGPGRWLSARPYTYISANEALLLFQDQIPASADRPDPSERPLRDYLSQDESEFVEVKGSAHVDIGRWVHTGEVQRADDVTNRVVQAVVGMLNADGGVIVVGALELKRFPEWKGMERLQVPVVGDYLVVGLEIDFAGKGWDEYARRLQMVIRSRIDPSPTGLVALSKGEIEGRTLCVVAVQATDREWFYFREANTAARFLVRQGSETLEYTGPLADGYKRTRRRG